MHAPAAPRTAVALPRPGPAVPPRAFLDLGAVLTAPGCARAWSREILREWQLTELADTAELIVSELVTNSVTAPGGRGMPVIRLVLTLDRGELAILVRDDKPGAPLPRNAGRDDENGRGLQLVESLSDRSGWYPVQHEAGAKVTWAVLRADPAPGNARPAPSSPWMLP